MVILCWLLLFMVQTHCSNVCYPGMPCYAPQNTASSEALPKPNTLEPKNNKPNYMIPVWKEKLYEAGNNESYQKLIDVLNEGGPHSVLVAYQGCRIINVLSHYKREVRHFPESRLPTQGQRRG